MKKRHPELVKAGLFEKDSDYEGMVGEAVQELYDVFVKQRHSGFSGPHVASIFYRLAKHEILTPLTGEDDEWMDVAGMGDDTIYQNKRLSSVFKEKATGRAYYLDAITWKTQKGSTWTGSAKTESGEIITSRQYIKKFPFIAKHFTIDVIENEVAKNDWEFTVKDSEKLLEVFEYYDEKIPD